MQSKTSAEKEPNSKVLPAPSSVSEKETAKAGKATKSKPKAKKAAAKKPAAKKPAAKKAPKKKGAKRSTKAKAAPVAMGSEG
ncbi:MAG: hypothetical protein SFY67_06765 [Candidatus Melainabacteria bacterium]|nr:hypothetical protein [Candidatus Melainabacteria bacterium]